jgi:hypothetical protein
LRIRVIDVAFQLGVLRAADLAHSAGADGRNHFIGPETGAGSEGQGRVIIGATSAST